MSVTLLSYCYSLRQSPKYMKLSKSQCIKVVLAVLWLLLWIAIEADMEWRALQRVLFNADDWLWLLFFLIACLFSTKILSINLRLKVVLAVPYALFWLAYVNETYPHGSPTIGEWLWLFIPMAWLFSTNIWRWARAG